MIYFDDDTSVADVGVPGGGGRERRHADRHGELPEKEQLGSRQDAPRQPSSASHHHVVAGIITDTDFSHLSVFGYQIFARAPRTLRDVVAIL